MSSEKLYKYYFFYEVEEGEEPELYAYTDDKSLAKEFELERDMNIFFKKKTEITKDEVNILAKDYKEMRLSILEGYTKDINNISKLIDFSLVVTELEKLTIISKYDEIINYDLCVYSRNTPFVFKKDIFKALEYLDYNYNFMIMYEPESADDYYQYDYELDLFGAFVYLFGKYLRKV